MAWTAKQRMWRVQAVRKRDGYRCWLCHKKFRGDFEITIDHAIPKARGGTNELSNLRLAHERCNHDRGAIQQTKPKAAQVRLEGFTLDRAA